MSIKIQVNSLAALERLIGGDTELEIDIRNNIVEAFAQKRLKALINVGLIEKQVGEIKGSIDKAIQIEVAKVTEKVGAMRHGAGWGSTFVLSDDTKKAISAATATRVNVLMDELLEESAKKALAYWSPNRVTEIIDTKIGKGIDALVDTRVRTRLDEIRKSLG